jgi:hypothetical protein
VLAGGSSGRRSSIGMSNELRVASFLTGNTEPVTGKLKAKGSKLEAKSGELKKLEVRIQKSEVKRKGGVSPPFAFGFSYQLSAVRSYLSV